MDAGYEACSKQEAELFNPVGVQSVLEDYSNCIYKNENTLENASSISVVIAPDPTHYIDLHDCKICMGLKIVKTGNADLEATDIVGTVNMPFTSIFKRVEVHIGGKQVDGMNDYDAIKNYMLTEVGYGAAAKKYTLGHLGYHEDTVKLMDQGTYKKSNGTDDLSDDKINWGFKQRCELTALSKVMDLCGPIPSDVFMRSQRLLPSKLEIRIVFKLNASDFVLMSADSTKGYTYKLTYFDVHIRKVAYESDHAISIEKIALVQPMLMPITRHELSLHTISNKDMYANFQNLFPNQLPKQILIGLVESDRLSGNIKMNPFKFEPFDLSRLTLRHGAKIISGYALEPKNNLGGEMLAFCNLLDARQCFARNQDIGFGITEFNTDRRIYCFTTSPDMEVEGLSQRRQPGGLSMEIHLEKAHDKAINVVVVGVFDNLIRITGNRAVVIDYS